MFHSSAHALIPGICSFLQPYFAEKGNKAGEANTFKAAWLMVLARGKVRMGVHVPWPPQ